MQGCGCALTCMKLVKSMNLVKSVGLVSLSKMLNGWRLKALWWHGSNICSRGTVRLSVLHILYLTCTAPFSDKNRGKGERERGQIGYTAPYYLHPFSTPICQSHVLCQIQQLHPYPTGCYSDTASLSHNCTGMLFYLNYGKACDAMWVCFITIILCHMCQQ